MGIDDSINLSEVPALLFAKVWSRIVSLKGGEEQALQALSHPDDAFFVISRRQFLEANRNDSERRRAALAGEEAYALISELISNLRNLGAKGRIIASGLYAGTGQRQLVPAELWPAVDRRSFLLAGVSLAGALAANGAQTGLGPPTPLGVPKRVWVQNPERILQNCAEWCWAASISMIFAMHGRRVPQEIIVQRVFGGLVCAPAPGGITMAQALSVPWIEKNGSTFIPRVVAAYDQMAGVNTINNNFIINELSNDRPILYANTHHAMVLTAVDYFDTPVGPNVVAAGVLDPWPASPGFHTLNQSELFPVFFGGQMMFLAAVHV